MRLLYLEVLHDGSVVAYATIDDKQIDTTIHFMHWRHALANYAVAIQYADQISVTAIPRDDDPDYDVAGPRTGR